MDATIWAMVYNKDLFAAAGLPELGTDDVINFDTWLEYSRAINKPGDSLDDRVWGSNMFWPIFNSMNNYMSSPYVLGDDGRSCDGNANNADWMHTWEVLNTAYEEDITTETAGVMLQDIEDDMFIQGKMGMTLRSAGGCALRQRPGVKCGINGPAGGHGWLGRKRGGLEYRPTASWQLPNIPMKPGNF